MYQSIMAAFIVTLLFSVSLFAQQAPADWQGPRASDQYDWRNTHWFGVSGGIITGPGITYRYWGEKNGWQFTAVPMIFNSDEYLFVLGAARLYSINTPQAATANSLGFTNLHYYWLMSTAHGVLSDNSSVEYYGSVNIGVGLDLERRVSRFSLMLGLGPVVLIENKESFEFTLQPAAEITWHFGAAQRKSK